MNSRISFQKNKFEKKGDFLYIDMSISIPFIPIKENEFITLTPILTKGEHQRELPHLLINGKQRHKGYKQMVRSLNEKTICSIYNIYKAFKIKRYINQTCTYNIQVDYENWMEHAKIRLIKQ